MPSSFGLGSKPLNGVALQKDKLTDTAEAVTRVLSEKAAGQDDLGFVDLI